MKIIQALPQHAHLIGKVVTMALGEELTQNLAGEKHTTKDVENLFTYLAALPDTQYSYNNTLAAIDSNGTVMGLIVCYDGALLNEMRKIFFKEAAKQIGMKITGNIDDIPPETTPDEFYLDSLAVFPQFRGKGVARELINAAIQRSLKTAKRPGLLVSKSNHNARALYTSLGFKIAEERLFAGEIMDHMTFKSQ